MSLFTSAGGAMGQNSIGFWITLAVVLVAATQFARTTAKFSYKSSAPAAIATPVSATPVTAAAPTTAITPAAISLHADSRGHFHTQAVVEGRSMSMMVDTGASLCAFDEEDAARLGIRVRPTDFTRSVSTANGFVRVAPVKIGVIQIGSIVVRDVDAVLIQRGLLGESLLGMSFLKRLRDFNMAGNRLTLRG